MATQMTTRVAVPVECARPARRRAAAAAVHLLRPLRLLLAAGRAFIRAGQLGPVSSIETGRHTGARR
jgi:hypothetical protein